jgi:hypothetical protein
VSQGAGRRETWEYCFTETALSQRVRLRRNDREGEEGKG